VKRLEQILFYLLLFAIPLQVRKILYYPEFLFNEWQAVSVYATDLLLIILFLFWAYVRFTKKYHVSSIMYQGGFRSFIPNTKYLIHKCDFFLIAFIVVAGLSIFKSSAQYLSVYHFIKLVEFVLFYFYIKNYAIYRFSILGSSLALIAGGVVQSIVAIIQFLKQSSIGLGIVGESVIGPNMRGVAVFYNFAGEKIMRAYGTLPHPNILATYLFLAIFAFYFIYIYYGLYHDKPEYLKKLDKPLLIAYFILLVGLFATFSRVVLLLWVLGFVIRAVAVMKRQAWRDLFIKDLFNRVRLKNILIVGLLAIVIFGGLYWDESISRVLISPADESVRLRVYYAEESLGSSFNLFGVGIGNFVNWLMVKDPGLMRYFYQPVHNIYLLIYSEVGILGIISFFLFLFYLIKDFILRNKFQRFYHLSFFVVFCSILFIGLFDHFLLTLQQGGLMFWLVLAMLSSMDMSKNRIHT